MPRSPKPYRLTSDLIATQSRGDVVCLDARAIGASFRLLGAEPRGYKIVADEAGNSALGPVALDEIAEPAFARIIISGPLEQRGGYHDICGGWTDGHASIADRLVAALQDERVGAVLLVIDSPGGVCAGLQESIKRVRAAKLATAKQIIAYADEDIASAAYWWTAAVCDEIYLPEAGAVGSIGARASHVSAAEALAQDGLAVTTFAWPPGKLALDGDRPLSDLGKARGERDVRMAAEAFFAAVSASRGLSVAAVRALDADMLTGAAAVAAGLADGVASLSDVEAWTLALAARGERPMNKNDRDNGAGAAEAEGDPAEADKVECPECHRANDPDANFCDGCGAKLAGPNNDAPPASDRPPPDSDRPGKLGEARGGAMSYATLAGLPEHASTPAIKRALSDQRSLARHAMKLTGARSVSEAWGGLDAIAKDAARVKSLEGKLATARAAADASERMDLLRKLEASGRYTRGELFDDIEDPKTGARKTVPAALWGDGEAGRPLGNLRGFVATALANQPVGKRTPFEPDPKALQESARITDQDRATAAKTGADPAKVAASRAALFPPNGARGASGA